MGERGRFDRRVIIASTAEAELQRDPWAITPSDGGGSQQCSNRHGETLPFL